MPPLQFADSELNSNLRLSNQWGPGPCTMLEVHFLLQANLPIPVRLS